MFDSAGQAVETLATEYALHPDIEPAFGLTAFFKPALADTNPNITVGSSREPHFRSTVERGRRLADIDDITLSVDDITDQLIAVANEQSIRPRRRAAYLDYCDDLFAFAALALELQKRYPTVPVTSATDYLFDAGRKVADGNLKDGLTPVLRAAEELYRTAIVVRRADQLFAALSPVGEPQLGRAKATLGGKLNEAIAQRDADYIDTVAERLDAVTDGEWTRDDLIACTHREFEVLIADLWREGGFDARATKYVCDYNIDVIAESNGERELIQAKQYQRDNKVGVRTIQRTAGLLVEFEADSVAVVTSSGFTTNAKESFDRMSKDVRLIDGERLCELLTRSQLIPSL